MKRILAVALVLVAVVSFSSCKKCFNCNKQVYQYCAQVEGSALGQSFNFNQCFSDSNARNDFASGIEGNVGALPGASASTTKSDTLIEELNQEVCGGNKTTNQNFVDLWEQQGYTCTEK